MNTKCKSGVDDWKIERVAKRKTIKKQKLKKPAS